MKALKERERERKRENTCTYAQQEESTYALGCLSFPFEELSFPPVICSREMSFIRTVSELFFSALNAFSPLPPRLLNVSSPFEASFAPCARGNIGCA